MRGALRGDSRHTLLGGDFVWEVERGHVDVFVAPMGPLGPAGRRRHVLRIAEGGLLVGAALRPGDGGFDLLLAGDPQTVVHRTAHRDGLPDGGEKRALAWLSSLTAAAGLPAPGAADGGSLQRCREHLAAAVAALGQQYEAERTQDEVRQSAAVQGEERELDRTLRRLARVHEQRSSTMPPAQGGHPLGRAVELAGRPLGLKVASPQADLDAPGALDAIARASGFRQRSVLLRGSWWRQDSGPMVGAFADGGAPVALLPRRGRYLLVDPASEDSPRPVDERLAGLLAPTAAALYRPFPDRPLTAKDVVGHALSGARGDLARLGGLGVVAALLAVVTPLAIGLLFDVVIPGAQRGQLVQLAMGLAVFALAGAAFDLTRGLALVRLEARMNADTQAAVWDRLMALPMRWFRDYSAGELEDRASGIDAIRRTLSGTLIAGAMSALFSLSNLFVMLVVDPRLTGLALLLSSAALGVTAMAAARLLGLEQKLADRRGRLASRLLDLVSGVSKLRVAGAHSRAFSHWAALFSPVRRTSIQVRRIRRNVDLFATTWPILCTLAIFWAAAHPTASALSTGAFLAFFAAFGVFLAGCLRLSMTLVSALRTIPLYRRAMPILRAARESGAGHAAPGDLTGEVDVSHLSFRYNDDSPLVLDDVTLHVRPGEFVALVGASGSGKSTLLRLLLGFEHPTGGAVYYDGQDLRGVDINAVRQQIGVVLQSSQVTAGDLFSNIAGGATLTESRAWTAATTAALADDIDAMPMGMHTVCAPNGANLSGGQRQRLLIARAVARDPAILMLDEATSALDNASQQVVTEALDRLAVTRVVVAHRLSTIRNADRIIVLQAGAIVQEGAYEALIAQPGPFADLARRQLS